MMIGGHSAEAAPEPNAAIDNDGFRADAAGPDASEALVYEDLYAGEEDVPVRRFGWVLPTLAMLLTLAWLGGMLWLALPSLRIGLAAIALIQFVAALCVPPALIGIIYLLLLRTSSAEARRFGATARAMRAEADALESKVAGLARKIEENRLALAEQTVVMIAMGDSASERLSRAAQEATDQTRAIEASTRTLNDATSEAERRVSIILSSLPKAHDEMRGMSERVDAAGLLASQRAASLDTQLTALSERGREADQVASGAAERLAAHIARMEATSETASSRLEQVTGEMSVAVDGVLDRAADAVDEARKGIAAQGEAILAMLSANQAALDRAGRDSADAMGERMGMIEDAIMRISLKLEEEQTRGDALFAGLSGGVDRLDRELQSLHASGMDRTQALSASISVLHQSMDAMTDAMHTGDATARTVIGTSEDLLTALDASAREIDETLPEALNRLDARIAASRQVVADAKPELLALVTAAESTHEAIEAIADVVQQQRDTLIKTQQSLLDTLSTGGEQAQILERIVDETIETTRRFAESASPQLVEAMVRVRETSTAAAEHARETLGAIVPHATRALEDASNTALKRAIDSSVRRQLTDLADTTEAAVAAATAASERLSHQMHLIAETTAKVEARIEEARTEQEKGDSESFARRVSLLIEALNSASIDITKAFSTEVTDSAWAAYLKGDRGVFTRRAVRLLEPGETREITRLYDLDDAFRDNVNRYIHDFEGMLRQILVLRDGSPLGVTLLSSDMGKLYVALAQAIERLRT